MLHNYHNPHARHSATPTTSPAHTAHTAHINHHPQNLPDVNSGSNCFELLALFLAKVLQKVSAGSTGGGVQQRVQVSAADA
jgi:hypothetical protein